MFETFDAAFLVVVGGFTAVIYWLIKIREQNASISSLMFLWGAFIALQILGFIASFPILLQSFLAVLFIGSLYKLGLVIRKNDRQRQKDQLRPLELDARQRQV